MTSDLTRVAEESAKGGFFLIVGSFFSTIISAVASIIVTRLLGQELYGQYALSLVVPQMLFLFTDFGISQGIVKFAASLRVKGETAQMTKIIQYGMLIRIIIGCAIFFVNFTLANQFAILFHNRPEIGIYIRIASFSILFQVVYTTVTSAYVGLDRTEYSAFTTNIQAISKAIIAIALVLAGFSIFGAVISYVAGYLIGGSIGLVLLLNIMKKHTAKDNDNIGLAGSLKILISYGMPLYIATLLVGFIPPYQNFVLGIFTTDAAIGNYKAAANFITLITIVSIPIITTLLPAFSKLENTTNEKVQTFFLFANKYTTMLIVPIVTIILAFSNEIVQIIYGPDFQTAGLFLAVYCLLYFLTGIGYLVLASMFNGLGETGTTLKINLITFAILVFLSPLLAYFCSVIGVIIALITSNLIGTLFGVYAAKEKYQVKFATKSIIKIYVIAAISTLPALLVLYFSPLHEFVTVILGGLLYLVMYLTLIPLMGIIDQTELQTVTRVARRIKPFSPILKPVLKYEQRILNIHKRKS
ncbi:MAG: oligosaccharide flippase family protein [Candidatus Bathyarchaeia archaeon]|jgi:O-antigen/teichoic acid export membrane protein|nr:oligosaccharide flippase family protein [Candidatus Bathyarchaeota archaeon A05DMB-4]MDH7596086.1 oligosaccharide flippase family protein [Candidatus Bathyarchaeota archaeon]